MKNTDTVVGATQSQVAIRVGNQFFINTKK